jgi:hypothetical protein
MKVVLLYRHGIGRGGARARPDAGHAFRRSVTMRRRLFRCADRSAALTRRR